MSSNKIEYNIRRKAALARVVKLKELINKHNINEPQYTQQLNQTFIEMVTDAMDFMPGFAQGIVEVAYTEIFIEGLSY